MMLPTLLAALGLNIIFSSNINFDCGSKNTNVYDVAGCYGNKNVFISYYAKDKDYVLYHEIGHSIFLLDQSSRDIIKDYKDLRYIPKDLYCSEKKVLDERVADYYSLYKRKNKEFSSTYPCLYIYFRDKEDMIVNK